jgi:hypothetical protein
MRLQFPQRQRAASHRTIRSIRTITEAKGKRYNDLNGDKDQYEPGCFMDAIELEMMPIAYFQVPVSTIFSPNISMHFHITLLLPALRMA